MARAQKRLRSQPTAAVPTQAGRFAVTPAVRTSGLPDVGAATGQRNLIVVASQADCIVGIDVGSQSIRALAFNAAGAKLASAALPTPATARPNGQVDYDPATIFATVVDVLAGIGAALRGRGIAGMAVASVGESCVIVGDDGQALAPMIAWFDRRSEPQALALSGRISPERMFDLTGVPSHPTLSLFKLAWMRDQWPNAFARTRRIMMMADWVAYRLSGVAATDPTLASRTLYFDTRTRLWSAELLALVGLDDTRPAPIAANGTALGPVRNQVLARAGLAGKPVVGVGGHDILCGAFGAGLVSPGMLLDSLGSGEALILMTTAPLSDPCVLRLGYFQGATGLSRPMSYIAGGIVSSGSAIEWLRALVGGPPHATIIGEAEAVPPGSDGIVFLPHLGNGPPPHPDPDSRGAFVGLSGNPTRGGLYRAVLEGLAMQSRMMLDAMTGLPGCAVPTEVRVIGGGSRNPLFLSIKASVLGRSITVIDEPEATALGAAMLGGIAAGLWPNLDAALESCARSTRVIDPDRTANRYRELREAAFEQLDDQLRQTHHALARFADRAE